MTSRQNGFSKFELPTGRSLWIPSDLSFRLPARSSVAASRLHALVYIPWDDRYLEGVDEAYREFFRVVLPYLHARSTDVHVAACLPFVPELVAADPEPVDERVVVLAFILHDSGWSQMSEDEIADSLGVQGLALSGEAVAPKLRHVQLGREIAERLIKGFAFQPPLTQAQEELIYQAILLHDKPAEVAASPASVRLVCDVDHLWSFTHEDFWQDVIRKDVEPPAYLTNLGADLDGYFVGAAGKRKARALLAERRREVAAWEKWQSAG